MNPPKIGVEEREGKYILFSFWQAYSKAPNSKERDKIIELYSNEIDTIHQQGVLSERERIETYLERLDGENSLFGYQEAIRNVKAFIKNTPLT